VLVHYLDIIRLAVSPNETNPPLAVDADAVLAGPISLEYFEVVVRGKPKLLQCFSGMEVEELSPRYTLDRPEAKHGPILKEHLRIPASERLNQDLVYYA
jgi:hypothetical protein